MASRFKFVFLLLCLLGFGQAKAQPIYNPSNGHFYQDVFQFMRWSEANVMASQSKMVFNGQVYYGHLVTLGSKEESDWVISHLIGFGRAHMGLYQPGGSKEPGQGWVWVTGEPSSFVNWGQGEPNNGNGGPAENFSSYFQDGTWNDIPDGFDNHSIVEYEPVRITGLSLSSIRIVGGKAVTGTISLAIAAPAGGMSVSLVDDSTDAKTPATVLIAQGQTQATFTITTKVVDSSKFVFLGARVGTSTASTSFTILPADVTAVSVNPTTIYGGSSDTVVGKVLLDGAAGPSGLDVQLSSDKSVLQVPGSVHVNAGATSASFAITHTLTPVPVVATISATNRGTVRGMRVNVAIVQLTKLTLTPGAVVAGGKVTGTLALNRAAPSGGFAVDLSSSSSHAILSSGQVVVPAGARQATFSVTTANDISVTERPTISAMFNGSSKTALFAVTPIQVKSLALSAASARKGETVVLTVMLNGPAPAGAAVSFSLSNGAATMASSGTITEGQTSGTFSVKANEVRADKTVVIKVSYHGVKKNVSLTVKAG